MAANRLLDPYAVGDAVPDARMRIVLPRKSRRRSMPSNDRITWQREFAQTQSRPQTDRKRSVTLCDRSCYSVSSISA